MSSKKSVFLPYALVITSALSSSVYGSFIIPGPSQEDLTRTFTFQLQRVHATREGDVIYAAARDEGMGAYTLSRAKISSMGFMPLAPERVVKLNKEDNQLNPLYNTPISLMSYLGTPAALFGWDDNPLVVTAKEPATLYLLSHVVSPHTIVMFSIPGITDATGVATQKIIAIEGTPRGHTAAFALVTPHNGAPFGAPGSGLAIGTFVVEEEKNAQEGEEKKTKERVFKQINVHEQAPEDQVCAVPLDVTSAAVRIGGPLAKIGEQAVLHWDAGVGRLYVGLDVTAGDNVGDGACAVLVGYFKIEMRGENKRYYFVLDAIAPADLIQDVPSLLGVCGAGARAFVRDLKMMTTTTGLQYLVVAGGNSAGDETATRVCAYPVAHTGTETQGKLARIDETPSAYMEFAEGNSYYKGRYFKEAATKTTHIHTSYDQQVTVGGAPLPGTLRSMNIVKDAVYAVVEKTDGSSACYYSQAFFDKQGQVQAWTQWQPFMAMVGHVACCVYDQFTTRVILAKGYQPGELDTFQSFGWSQGDKEGTGPLLALLKEYISQDKGGVRALFHAPMGSAGLPRQALLAMATHDTVILNELAYQEADGQVTMMRVGNQPPHKTVSNDGALPAHAPMMVCSGGALACLKSCDALTTAAVDDQAWLFVGGARGLCVLVDEQSHGWPAHEGLGRYGVSTEGRRFIRVGNYTFVRRLIHDGDYLYVMTLDRCDRINIRMSRFGEQEQLETTTIAQAHLLDGSKDVGGFHDLLVSGKFGLLATTRGLFRVGNGRDIRFAAAPHEVNWTEIARQGTSDPVVQLYPITTTGFVADCARAGGSNVYALNAYVGENRAQVVRYTIADCTNAPIDENTVREIPDYQVESRAPEFRHLDGYAHCFAFDGATAIYASSRFGKNPPKVRIVHGTQPAYDLPLTFDPRAIDRLRTIQRLSTYGLWLIAGDTVLVNE